MLVIPPMLATRLEDPHGLTNQIYIAKPKLDGQCDQVHIQGHRSIRAFNRPGRELIRLPGLAWLKEARWAVASAILDGEVVAGDGSEGIQAVFEARNRTGSPMAFAAFRLLEAMECGSARPETGAMCRSSRAKGPRSPTPSAKNTPTSLGRNAMREVVSGNPADSKGKD